MDKEYKRYIRPNLSLLQDQIHVLGMMKELRCLTTSDQQRIRAEFNNHGDMVAAGMLIECLRRRDNWFNILMEALCKDSVGLLHVAKTIDPEHHAVVEAEFAQDQLAAELEAAQQKPTVSPQRSTSGTVNNFIHCENVQVGDQATQHIATDRARQLEHMAARPAVLSQQDSIHSDSSVSICRENFDDASSASAGSFVEESGQVRSDLAASNIPTECRSMPATEATQVLPSGAQTSPYLTELATTRAASQPGMTEAPPPYSEAPQPGECSSGVSVNTVRAAYDEQMALPVHPSRKLSGEENETAVKEIDTGAVGGRSVGHYRPGQFSSVVPENVAVVAQESQSPSHKHPSAKLSHEADETHVKQVHAATAQRPVQPMGLADSDTTRATERTTSYQPAHDGIRGVTDSQQPYQRHPMDKLGAEMHRQRELVDEQTISTGKSTTPKQRRQPIEHVEERRQFSRLSDRQRASPERIARGHSDMPRPSVPRVPLADPLSLTRPSVYRVPLADPLSLNLRVDDATPSNFTSHIHSCHNSRPECQSSIPPHQATADDQSSSVELSSQFYAQDEKPEPLKAKKSATYAVVHRPPNSQIPDLHNLLNFPSHSSPNESSSIENRSISDRSGTDSFNMAYTECHSHGSELLADNIAPVQSGTNVDNISPVKRGSNVANISPVKRGTNVDSIAGTNVDNSAPVKSGTNVDNIAPLKRGSYVCNSAPVKHGRNVGNIVPVKRGTDVDNIAPLKRGSYVCNIATVKTGTNVDSIAGTNVDNIAPVKTGTNVDNIVPVKRGTNVDSIAGTSVDKISPVKHSRNVGNVSPVKRGTNVGNIAPIKHSNITPVKRGNFAPIKRGNFAPIKRGTNVDSIAGSSVDKISPVKRGSNVDRTGWYSAERGDGVNRYHSMVVVILVVVLGALMGRKFIF